jgi:hypothetical protein
MCLWCNEESEPEMILLQKELRTIRERRCSICGKILAAYLMEEGNFMSDVRKFPN